MAFFKYKDLPNSDLEEEILREKQNYFDLKVKKTGNPEDKSFKVHLHKHIRRRIAQLTFKLEKTKNQKK